jgi:YidC/Oxa1 family membrane protein insertase
MGILNELRSFYTFYRKIPKNEREIVFYSEDIASFRYFEGLIDYLTTEENLKICYITSDTSDPILSQKRSNIKALYIKSLLAFFTVTLDSKLLIMTMPDLHQLHVRRSERGTHHVYLFHNIGSSFPVIRFGALFHYDTIFCAGPHHIEEIRAQEDLYNLPKKHLVEFGYSSLEKIYNDYKNYDHSKKKPSAYKARILIAPSWGDNSILNFCGSKLIRILLESNYEVIVRPHPMTKINSPKVLQSLNKEFENFDNYVFEGEITSTESFYNSDLLISDWSGVSYEYAFGTERPVLCIDVPQKIVNERYKEIGIEPVDIGIRNRLGAVLKPDELEKADSLITHILANKDTYVAEIIKARGEFVYNFGDSSRIGVKYIRDFLDRVTK